MSLQAIAECWKRFVLPTESFCWSLFRLLDTHSIGEMVSLEDLQANQRACEQCAGLEFSMPILQFVHASNPDRAAALKSILEDLPIHAH